MSDSKKKPNSGRKGDQKMKPYLVYNLTVQKQHKLRWELRWELALLEGIYLKKQFLHLTKVAQKCENDVRKMLKTCLKHTKNTKKASQTRCFSVYKGANQTPPCPLEHGGYRNQFDSRILSKLYKQQKDFRRSPFVVYKGANQNRTDE